MLSALHIQNFTIVSSLALDFSPGMTAFTGETGAGKSILIDALLLALGERADLALIRPGAEKCDISACFTIDAGSAPAVWLAEHELALEDETLILRRVLYAEGRSKSFINGQPFPVQKIRELANLLVLIHSQHQHHNLLQPNYHREQLDNFAKHPELLKAVTQTYKQYQATKSAIDALKTQGALQDRAERLVFQTQELESLALEVGEMPRLHQEHQVLHHACDYLQAVDLLREGLDGEEQQSVSKRLSQLLHRVESLPREQGRVKAVYELLQGALIQVEEALVEINHFAAEVQLDPERLQAVEQRISLLHQTARKYQVEASQLPALAARLQQELANLKNSGEELLRLEKELEHHASAYEIAALALRASRQEAALRLERAVTASIQDLGMGQGYLKLAFSPLEQRQASGLDRVEFQVCTNPGMPLDSLSKIASGGEISRISLAIQMITAEQAKSPTLFFDEVDVGIGGSTAALVGQMLRKLGQRLQIFCVTHQPQVASSAHQHFLVAKKSQDGQTFSSIQALDEEGRVQEIARMLGGVKITEQTRSHAKSMLLESA